MLNVQFHLFQEIINQFTAVIVLENTNQMTEVEEMTEMEEMTEVQDIQEMIEIPEMVEIENKQL